MPLLSSSRRRYKSVKEKENFMDAGIAVILMIGAVLIGALTSGTIGALTGFLIGAGICLVASVVHDRVRKT